MLPSDDIKFLKEFAKKIEKHKWAQMYFDPKNKTFRPILKSNNVVFSEMKKKLKQNPKKYPEGYELVHVNMGVFPNNLKDKRTTLRWVFRLSVKILKIINGRLMNTVDDRFLVVNWYINDLREKKFTMKTLETISKLVYKYNFKTNPLSGVSITYLRNKIKTIKKKK